MKTMKPSAKFSIALITLALANLCTPVRANPTGPTVVNGTATFANPNPNTLEVTNSRGAIINWQGFSINAGEITRFLQPDAASAVLNRVVGTDPSQILGTLQSNGRVFLINPNGIVFGAGAVVDVQGLVASTLDMSNNDFLSGNYNFLQTATGAPISLQSGAQITTVNAGNGGQVWLLAKTINQEAGSSITTPGGQTVLATGTQVRVAESALGNMIFNVTTDGTNDIQTLGTIAVDRGVAGLFADNITHGGNINTQSAGNVQGRVVMNADNNLTVLDGGVINANSSDGSNAGSINLTAGNKLEVQRLASVSADGATNGGNGGQINLTALDLRVSPVANGYGNVHASTRSSSGVSGTVTLNQTGNPTFQPQGELLIVNNPQTNSTITTLADGGYVVAGVRNQNGNNDIYAQRYDANGNAVGSEYVVSNAANDQSRPSVTALADGGFVVTWDSQRSQPNSSNPFPGSDIYARRYDASGNAVGSEFVVSNGVDSQVGQLNPSITALADGGFVVTWDSIVFGGNHSIYARRYDATGNATGSELIITNTAGQSFPTIAPLADGGFVVTWQRNKNNNNSDLYARRYDAAGNAVGSEFLISAAGREPAVSALANGGFVVTWQKDSGFYAYDIYARQYDANSNAVGNEFLIRKGAYNTGAQIFSFLDPAISSLADGEFVATWNSYFSYYFLGWGTAYVQRVVRTAYAQRYDASGSAVGSVFPLSDPEGNQFQPKITALANGGFVTTWYSAPILGNPGIYAQRYDKVPAAFTQDDNQVTGELDSVAGFNTRPGLTNVISPTTGSTVTPTLPSEAERELALSNGVCQNLSQTSGLESLPEGEASEATLTTNTTGLGCRQQGNAQIHPDAMGSGWNNQTQVPSQEQAYAQMVGDEEYTLTQGMSWRARQAYWNEHRQKQSTLSEAEYANYLNQVRSMSEEERVQYYERLTQEKQ
jgi:filamentous hemagglutinin family protein